MKRSIVRKPRRRVGKKVVKRPAKVKIQKEPFKNKLKIILNDIVRPKYIPEILGLKFENGDEIFDSKNIDVIYQLLFILKDNTEDTINMLKRGWKDQTDLYFNLNVFDKIKYNHIQIENEYFNIIDVLESGIQCRNKRCLSFNVRIIDLGPTSGDEASRSLYKCNECNFPPQRA